MQLIADLHLHSHFSRAVSREMTIPNIALWARKKGIGLVATGDWTHPLWMKEIERDLEECGNGIFQLKTNKDQMPGSAPYFLLSTEISCIFSQNGKTRRVHTVVWVPSMESARKISQEITKRGGNVLSDGRPIVGFSLIQLSELILCIEPHALIVPAHCLLTDSMILDQNYIPHRIDSFHEEDFVLTHTGSFQRVTEIKKRIYKGNVIHIQPWYFRPGLITTPEHPYWAIKPIKKCVSTGDVCRPSKAHLLVCRKKLCLQYKPSWIKAENLEIGDILVYPRSTNYKINGQTKLSDSSDTQQGFIKTGGTRGRVFAALLDITPQAGRLIGYYLAEGSTDGDNSISFCFGSKEQLYIDDVVDIIKKTFKIDHYRLYNRKGSNGAELTFYSKMLATWLANSCYGQNQTHQANNKVIPSFILHADLSVQAECLRGWYRGDHGYTTSRTLINQFKAICLRIGIIPSVIVDSTEDHALRGNHRYKDRIIKANYDVYAMFNLSFFEDAYDIKKDIQKSKTKLDRKHGWIDKENVYIPIKDITSKSYNGFVYNLEVEHDHSYVSEFAAVHNCWTPWFSVYGSMGGFESLKEAFGSYEKQIYAVETGLSSSPDMNWMVGELDTRSIVSFSDAHSGPKLGREATVFELPELSFSNIQRALQNYHIDKTKPYIIKTIEFYPEEGKYHYTGHRDCHIRLTPDEVKAKGTTCSVCGKPLTQGVMQRVAQLATRAHQETLPNRPPFTMLVPLVEIISEAIGSPVTSPKVAIHYDRLITKCQNEFHVLMDENEETIATLSTPQIADGIRKVRMGDIVIEPGYDGVFGVVKIWKSEKDKELVSSTGVQIGIF